MGSISINEDVFSEIDTKEKAYWLGFLYADGNVSSKGNRIGFHLAYKDFILLERFCDFVDGDRTKIMSYDNNKTACYYVYSNKMKSDLAKYNIVPRKTYIDEFPKFENIEIFLAFFLGAYDGDGTEGCSIISSANINFLTYCCEQFNMSNTKIVEKNNRYGNCYCLNIGSKNYENVLLNYENSLERKRKTSSKSFGSDMNLLSNCVTCNTVISKNAIKCKKCAAEEYNRKHIQFEVPKCELESLIKEYPLTEIGKLFGVSDNAIRKRCKKFGIELKPMRGHWRKVETGKI